MLCDEKNNNKPRRVIWEKLGLMVFYEGVMNERFVAVSTVRTGEIDCEACIAQQWRRQEWGTGAPAPPPDFQQFHFSSLWSKSDS